MTDRSLDEQRREFAKRRLVAMPIAGTIAAITIVVLERRWRAVQRD